MRICLIRLVDWFRFIFDRIWRWCKKWSEQKKMTDRQDSINLAMVPMNRAFFHRKFIGLIRTSKMYLNELKMTSQFFKFDRNVRIMNFKWWNSCSGFAQGFGFTFYLNCFRIFSLHGATVCIIDVDLTFGKEIQVK